jgi:hypothetical protein
MVESRLRVDLVTWLCSMRDPAHIAPLIAWLSFERQ